MDFNKLDIDLIFGQAFAYFRETIRKESVEETRKKLKVTASLIRLMEKGNSKFNQKRFFSLLKFFECDVAKLSLFFSLIVAEEKETLLSNDYYSGLKEILEEEYSEENKDERSVKIIAWLQGDLTNESSSRMNKALRFYNAAETLFKESK